MLPRIGQLPVVLEAAAVVALVVGKVVAMAVAAATAVLAAVMVDAGPHTRYNM